MPEAHFICLIDGKLNKIFKKKEKERIKNNKKKFKKEKKKDMYFKK